MSNKQLNFQYNIIIIKVSLCQVLTPNTDRANDQRYKFNLRLKLLRLLCCVEDNNKYERGWRVLQTLSRHERLKLSAINSMSLNQEDTRTFIT